MVRALFLPLLLCTVLFGDLLDEKIRSFVTPNQYGVHSKLISKIFSDRGLFYDGSSVNSLKVLEKLKQDGLLRLDMKVPGEVSIRFRLDFSSFFAIKAISDSLGAIGYNYFTVSSARNGEDGFYLDLSIDTEYNPDPVLLGEEFIKRGIKIGDISKEGNSWGYVLSTFDPTMPEAERINIGERKNVSKLFDNYWLDIKGGGSSLSLDSQSGNNWHPYVVFYDKHLNILSIFESESRSTRESFDIPSGTRFIKVGDSYGFYNIKNGFSVGLN